MSSTLAALAPRLIRVKQGIAMKQKDPISFWRFAVPRLREAFALLTAPDPIDELHLRACNKGGKTEVIASYVIDCCQKRTHLDGVSLPQWRGRVEAVQLVLDYPQQMLSVQPAYLRLLGEWPHHARYKGEILSTLRIKPVNGSDDERTWSVIQFLSQKNLLSGTGVRGDIVAFDEPPVMSILRELRKAAHAGRRMVMLIGETPTLRRQWAPLKEDYGDCPRRSIRRVDQERAEVRWSLDEVADWVLSPAEKDKLRRKYQTDPLRDAREHGDYIDTSGLCPFNLKVLEQMLAECKPPLEMVQWKISHEVREGGTRTKKVTNVPVQLWKHAELGKRYYIPIDPASGSSGGHPLGLHVVEWDTGDLVARVLAHIPPYVMGVLSAGLARQYNDALIQPEVNDGWATGVIQGIVDSKYGRIGKEPQELRPGEWHDELGFRTTPKTRPGMIEQVQRWITAWGAGIKYAYCPSSEVISNLMDVVLDDNDKPVVIPGAHHGEDMILRGQGLKKTVRRAGMEIPESNPPVKPTDYDLIQSIRGQATDPIEAPFHQAIMKPKSRPRL